MSTDRITLADHLEHIDPTDFLYVLRDTAGKAAEALAAAIADAQAVYDKLARLASQSEKVAELAAASDLFPTHHANIPHEAGLVRAEAAVPLCDTPIAGGRCIRPANHAHDGHTPGVPIKKLAESAPAITIVPADTALRIRAIELESAARDLLDPALAHHISDEPIPGDVRQRLAAWLNGRAGIYREDAASFEEKSGE